MSTFRVLAIDDNPYALQMIESSLAGSGYVVDTARSGRDGLEKAVAQPPDAVLLDLLMPGIDGLEVLRRLREDDTLSEVPVIVITSADERPARLDAIRAGADDFLAKPVNVPELRARLSTLEKLNRFRRLATERARLGWMAEGCREGLVLLRPDGSIGWANGAARRFLGVATSGRDIGSPFARVLAERFVAVLPGSLEEWPRMPDFLLVRPATRSAPSLWLRVEALNAGPESLSVRLTDVTAALQSFRTSRFAATALRHRLPISTETLLAELEMPPLAAAAGLSPAEVSAIATRVSDAAGVAVAVELAEGGDDSWLLPLSAVRLETTLFEVFRVAREAAGGTLPRLGLRLGRNGHALTLSLLGEAAGTLLEDPSAPQRALGRVAAGGVNGTSSGELGLAWVALCVGDAGGTLAVEPKGPGSAVSVELRFREAA